MPRNNDIADWGRTVKETLSQLGNKQKPAKTPRVRYSSLSQSSRTRQQSLGKNRAKRQVQRNVNRNIR
jgi:hypothetical protein